MTELPPIAEYFDDEPIVAPAGMHSAEIKIDSKIKTAFCTFLCENIDAALLKPILKDCQLLFYVFGRSGKVPVFQYKQNCLIVLMTVGSPVATAVVEELKYLGVENIIAYGTAGQLDAHLPSDACVLLEKAIRDDTCLVTIMYANNEIGSVMPIKEIGEICKEKKVLFHTDAVQAAGHLPIDVHEQNIDMLSLSAHKFHGPKGIGALYVRKGILLTNLIEGGAQERGKRAGTENVPEIVSMAAALEEACSNMEENMRKTTALRDRLIEGLSMIPYSALNGDPVHRLPGNVNFCFEGVEGESLLLLLDDKGICASSGSACTSGSLDPSHVLLSIGRPHEVAHGSLRLSLCEENTEEEVEHILKSLPEVVAYLRNMSPLWKDKVSGKKAFVLPE